MEKQIIEKNIYLVRSQSVMLDEDLNLAEESALRSQFASEKDQ